jgi:NADH dehydrogenase FAD-containing subunit
MVESSGTADANRLREYFEQLSLAPSRPKENSSHGQSVIIVGAGAFGTSLALELVTNHKDKYLLFKEQL